MLQVRGASAGEEHRAGTNALVSVIMPCCGQLEFTRLSVPRVLRLSREPFELLFIDAGSLDGTREYLAGVAAAAPARVELLRGSQESAFADLVTAALSLARGAFVAWLNNDVLVTELWLQQMVALATANDAIGVVGPMANVALEGQRVFPVPYRLKRPGVTDDRQGTGGTRIETEAVDRFAQEFRQTNQGQWGECGQVSGFCWLGKREVLGQVSLFEGGSDGEVFFASRFCDRVRSTGYRVACCKDLYVHHFGSNLIG